MKNLIWGVLFYFAQNWFNRWLGREVVSSTNKSGISFIEAAERTVRRLLLVAVTMTAAGFAGLVGLYYVIQTLRYFLERNLGWDPTGVTALFAILFLGSGVYILSLAKSKPEIEQSGSQLPASIGSPTALKT